MRSPPRTNAVGSRRNTTIPALAYTVRSLSGMIARCGLLEIKGLSPNDAWKRIDQGFDCYRKRKLSAAYKN